MKETTVSLVLGGGGARGLAHIGVIQWLEDNGFNIRSISGCSMGALVGGIYANSKLDVYANWVSDLERIHVLRLLDPALGRPGLLKGERIIDVLRDMVGDVSIEELPIAYTAVATDLNSGEEVWLRKGRMFDAIRASIATPLVFTPFQHGERLLLDGALVNPVPIAPTLDDATDLTVAVNLGGPAQPAMADAPHTSQPAGQRVGKPSLVPAVLAGLRARAPRRQPRRGMVDVALVSMQAMQDTIAQLRMDAYRPDVTIDIPRNACGFHEFWRAREMIDVGRRLAAQAFASRA
jgi:NTE family protein